MQPQPAGEHRRPLGGRAPTDGHERERRGRGRDQQPDEQPLAARDGAERDDRGRGPGREDDELAEAQRSDEAAPLERSEPVRAGVGVRLVHHVLPASLSPGPLLPGGLTADGADATLSGAGAVAGGSARAAPPARPAMRAGELLGHREADDRRGGVGARRGGDRAPHRTALNPGVRRRLGERDDPQQQERRQRGDEHDRGAGDQRGPSAVAVAGVRHRRARERDRAGDRELREDDRDQPVDEAPAPVRGPLPDHRRERQRQERDGDVDRRLAHDELEPDHERHQREEQAAEKQQESRQRAAGQRARREDVADVLEELAGVGLEASEDLGGHPVGHAECDLDERHRREAQTQRQRKRDERRPQEHRDVLAQRRVDDRAEQDDESQGDGESDHRAVLRREPRAAERRPRGALEHLADPAHEPRGTSCDPARQAAHRRVADGTEARRHRVARERRWRR